MTLYFNAHHLPHPANEYVCWVDVMGTQASMSSAIRVAANFIFKLHIAALQAPRAAVRIYPVMDGFYAAAIQKGEMLDFLRSVFGAAAATFNAETENRFRFVIRGALAYGPVVHGHSLPADTSPTLAANANYRAQLLLGMPIVQAHLAEASAPPFGIHVHESARAFAPVGTLPLYDRWWSWDVPTAAETHGAWTALPQALDDYYNWCQARAAKIEYSLDRIAAHRQMAHQYFA